MTMMMIVVVMVMLVIVMGMVMLIVMAILFVKARRCGEEVVDEIGISHHVWRALFTWGHANRSV